MNDDDLTRFGQGVALCLLILFAVVFGTGCIPVRPDCPGGTQLGSGSCLYGQTDQAGWVQEVEFAIGLPHPVDIWLFETGEEVTAAFTGPLPQGACVNGWYDDGVVVAIPGTLPHELMHAYSDQVGAYVPVYEVPNLSLLELYELQHTPEYGWLDGFDDNIRHAYQYYGWPDMESEVCSGWR